MARDTCWYWSFVVGQWKSKSKSNNYSIWDFQLGDDYPIQMIVEKINPILVGFWLEVSILDFGQDPRLEPNKNRHSNVRPAWEVLEYVTIPLRSELPSANQTWQYQIHHL